ncbi:MAG TPA: NAD(P)-dependent alcohol dehydrogenase [Bacteroidia bacterium]|nr:NAD(P)-dependent alcohol dehydrogenase [Bacteroidia bacterium]
MKAAVRSKYGPPEMLEIKVTGRPTPKDNEILVRVHAATVNRTDCGGLSGKPYIYRFFCGWPNPRLASTGTDFAGMVEEVGKNVTTFKPGDRVWGFNDHILGSHAQYITLSQKDNVLAIPGNISYEQAAASAEGAHYAINFINKTALKAGDNVMVYGATGAIGSAMVQLLKYYGANVTAVCRAGYPKVINTLGADRVIETDDLGVEEEGSYHFIFDAVGKSSFRACKPLLQKGGVYISSELGPGNENLYLPLTTCFADKRVIFPFPTDINASLKLIGNLLENKQFKPVIDRRYPLEQIQEAFYYVNSGLKTGNVILTMD